ncbi:MAG: DUF1553 domain-containing protein, partial [Verrucomicrobiota bacterium]
AGVRPSHPRLLDDLAHRFIHQYNWSTKSLLREIVLSNTYRQTARVPAEIRTQDPMNRWLSYGPRQRLTSEMVRDASLQVAGLLSSKRLGGVAHPPIPKGVWQPFVAKDKWETPQPGNENRYRRMIYTYTKREIPFPSMSVFDAPSREFCEQRRSVSNTPLQALTTLNDEAYFEAAQAFAKKHLPSKPNTNLQTRLDAAYRAATSQNPSPETRSTLLNYQQKFLTHYQQNPHLAKQLNLSPQQAAHTMLANIILNLDEFLTR